MKTGADFLALFQSESDRCAVEKTLYRGRIVLTMLTRDKVFADHSPSFAAERGVK